MNVEQAINEIKEIPEVTDARLWDKVPGKERIYIDTNKYNGGKNWNGGKGYHTLYIDINAKKLIAEGEAGAATRKRLMDTLEELRDIANTVCL